LHEGEYARSVDNHIPQNLTPPESHQAILHDDNDGSLMPHQGMEKDSDWMEVARKMERDETLQLKVIGYNRGGLLVEWESLRGFVPASQLVDFPVTEESQQRRAALVERVGDLLSLRVIELDPEKNRLILSERAAQVEAGTREEILHSLSPGDVIQGIVTNLCDFGAFVDLGGVEGLIHISELSWGRVGHPEDMLERDENVHVYVLDVDPENARVALSLKRLHPDPWATVDERYEIGEVVEGKITNVVDFGAFACIEEGLEGLIHFSELAEGHFLHPRNVVSEGDIVHARILSIDGNARRLGLSLRLL
jgi:small subunit ribosomal protein S1